MNWEIFVILLLPFQNIHVVSNSKNAAHTQSILSLYVYSSKKYHHTYRNYRWKCNKGNGKNSIINRDFTTGHYGCFLGFLSEKYLR